MAFCGTDTTHTSLLECFGMSSWIREGAVRRCCFCFSRFERFDVSDLNDLVNRPEDTADMTGALGKLPGLRHVVTLAPSPVLGV